MTDVTGLVQDQLRPEQRGAGAGRRHHARAGAREGRKILRRHSARPAGGAQRAWIAKRSGTHRGSVQDRVPQARIYRMWNVPGADTPEEALLDLAAHVLGGSKTSRLYQRLVVKEQLATSASPATTRTRSPASSAST
jgi:predicted Zn-dependent peptidase